MSNENKITMKENISNEKQNQQSCKTGVIGSFNDKGEFNGKCNITSCQKPNSAIWYNHSTRKYYCSTCAIRLNNDEFNKRDAMLMFGHDLCTLSPTDCKHENIKREDGLDECMDCGVRNY